MREYEPHRARTIDVRVRLEPSPRAWRRFWRSGGRAGAFSVSRWENDLDGRAG
jgi:hypothetical protein